MTKFIYRVNSDSLSHAQDAATQRRNYDSQKRRERYLRDRAAGKTGYQGIEARTNNPYGNYSNAYYDPRKAAEYYQAHKKTSSSGSRRTSNSTASSGGYYRR